jgi:hypothetical protein
MDANMAMALIISFSPEVGVSKNEQPVMSIITRQGKTIIARYPGESLFNVKVNVTSGYGSGQHW